MNFILVRASFLSKPMIPTLKSFPYQATSIKRTVQAQQNDKPKSLEVKQENQKEKKRIFSKEELHYIFEEYHAWKKEHKPSPRRTIPALVMGFLIAVGIRMSQSQIVDDLKVYQKDFLAWAYKKLTKWLPKTVLELAWVKASLAYLKTFVLFFIGFGIFLLMALYGS